MVTQLVYVSAAVRPLLRADLAQILRASRRHNPAVGVTGVLVYADRAILQVLEGPPEAVDATFARAAADPRHHGILVLYRAIAGERTFPDWTMGLYRAADLSDDGRDHAESMFDLAGGRAGDRGPIPPSRVRRFLASFAAAARPSRPFD